MVASKEGIELQTVLRKESSLWAGQTSHPYGSAWANPLYCPRGTLPVFVWTRLAVF